MFDQIPFIIFVEIGFSFLLGFVSLTPTYKTHPNLRDLIKISKIF